MRPNEHKQKRSVQYKKKHGIKSGEQKSGKAAKSGSVCSGTGSSASTVDLSDGTRPTASTGNAQKTTSQEEQPQQVHKSQKGQDARHNLSYNDDLFRNQKQFKRREVQSNWDKYDLPPADNDSVTMRGADFQALLDAASTAVSQFQFEEEKDWNQGETVDYEGWMTVDCKGLAATMLTLPLHQRLGLDEKYFMKEHIDLFMDEAKQHKQENAEKDTCSSTAEDVKPINICKTNGSNVLDDMLDDLLGGENDKLSDSRHITEHSEKELRPEEDKSEGLTSHIKKDKRGVEDDLDDLLADTSKQKEDKNSEVDTLLSQEEPAASQPSNHKLSASKLIYFNEKSESQVKVEEAGTKPMKKNTTQASDFKPKEVNLEDELDNLLDLDQPPKLTTLATKETGALDDWLDSMLED